MTSKDEIVKTISSLIKNGINMDNYNIFECNVFMKDLYNFINANTHLNAHYSNRKITIESVFFDPLLSVELDKTTIQCIPITDEGWIDAVFEVLKFMHIRAEKKKQTEKEQRKKQEEHDRELDWI